LKVLQRPVAAVSTEPWAHSSSALVAACARDCANGSCYQPYCCDLGCAAGRAAALASTDCHRRAQQHSPACRARKTPVGSCPTQHLQTRHACVSAHCELTTHRLRPDECSVALLLRILLLIRGSFEGEPTAAAAAAAACSLPTDPRA
jgi:hypothetical protein